MVEAIIKRVLDTVRSNRNVDLISVSGDYGARFICAVLAVDGVPIKVAASCAVTINAKRADGQSKAFEGSVNEDGTVKVPITQWMLEIAHTRTECTVSAFGIDTKLSATPFDIEVAETPHQSEEISPDDPDYDVLVQVLAGEASRNAAEAARVKAEEARALAEKERASAETERDQAETEREEAEALRATAETQREQAEASRNAAEAARVKAEEARASAFLAMDGRISRNEKRVATLEAAVYGDLAQEVEDNSVAYVKDVPSNALSAVKISKIGGMTRKCTNLCPMIKVHSGMTISDGVATQTQTDTKTQLWFAIQSYKDAALVKNIVVDYVITAPNRYNWSFVKDASFDKLVFGHSGSVQDVKCNTNVKHLTDGDTYTFSLTITNATQGSFSWKDVQINKGSDALPYEPYFEGLRSAPVTEVESVGVNLFDKKTIKINQGLGKDGKPYNTQGKCYSDAIAVQEGSIYSVSNIDWYNFYYNAEKPSNNNFILQSATTLVTVPNGVKYIRLSMAMEKIDIAMLNRGANALPYTPYQEHTLPIPEAVQALDGYGLGIDDTLYNYIDWGKKQFVQRVKEIVFDGSDDENWSVFNNNLYTNVLDKVVKDKSLVLSDCAYTVYVGGGVNAFGVETNGALDVASWKAYLAGNPMTVCYELAEPIITDISDILSADNYIEVEGGGTLTFENEYKYDVPSEVTFVTKEVSE